MILQLNYAVHNDSGYILNGGVSLCGTVCQWINQHKIYGGGACSVYTQTG